MKKLICLSLLLICFSFSSLYGGDYIVKSDLNFKTFDALTGTFRPQETWLAFDTDYQHLNWYIYDPLTPVVISLKDPVRKTFIKYLRKYEEWSKLASQKRVKIKKEIGDLPPTLAS